MCMCCRTMFGLLGLWALLFICSKISDLRDWYDDYRDMRDCKLSFGICLDCRYRDKCKRYTSIFTSNR